MIGIRDLTVNFGGVVALDRLTMDIVGGVVGIIGPNGAGKTTLINALSGFVSPSAGQVIIDGFDLLSLKPHRRARWGLARSFQQVHTVPDLTVKEQVRAALDFQTMRGRESRMAVEHALDYVGLGDLANRAGRRLNPFQKRMTEVARCLALRPRIVLLDEPGGGLSEAEVTKLRDVIEGIGAEFGAQVVLIDHDVRLIRAVCIKTAVLDFGRLIAYDLTEPVLADRRVMAAYLGEQA